MSWTAGVTLLVLTALGGAAGGGARLFFIRRLSNRLQGEWALSLINLSGCFLAGLAWTLGLFGQGPTHGFSGQGSFAGLILLGFLGGYTTVSAYALQTRLLWGEERFKAALYFILTPPVCVIAALAGAFLGPAIGAVL